MILQVFQWICDSCGQTFEQRAGEVTDMSRGFLYQYPPGWVIVAYSTENSHECRHLCGVCGKDIPRKTLQ